MEIRIKRGEEQFGPYLPDEVRAYLREGRLALDDLASTDGNAWRPLRELLGGYPPAGLAPRFGAAILDVLVSMVFLLPGFLDALAGFDVGLSDEDWLLVGAGGLAGLVYQLVKDGFGGRSLGKRANGLIVIHLPTNTPCSMLRSAARGVVTFAANLVPAVGWVIEPILIIVTRDRRRLADHAASTQVIYLADYQA